MLRSMLDRRQDLRTTCVQGTVISYPNAFGIECCMCSCYDFLICNWDTMCQRYVSRLCRSVDHFAVPGLGMPPPDLCICSVFYVKHDKDD